MSISLHCRSGRTAEATAKRAVTFFTAELSFACPAEQNTAVRGAVGAHALCGQRASGPGKMGRRNPDARVSPQAAVGQKRLPAAWRLYGSQPGWYKGHHRFPPRGRRPADASDRHQFDCAEVTRKKCGTTRRGLRVVPGIGEVTSTTASEQGSGCSMDDVRYVHPDGKRILPLEAAGRGGGGVA